MTYTRRMRVAVFVLGVVTLTTCIASGLYFTFDIPVPKLAALYWVLAATTAPGLTQRAYVGFDRPITDKESWPGT